MSAHPTSPTHDGPSPPDWMFCCWAKLGDDDGSPGYHPLLCHMIDVAMVTFETWRSVLSSRQREARTRTPPAVGARFLPDCTTWARRPRPSSFRWTGYARRVDWFSFTVTWLTAIQSLLAGLSKSTTAAGSPLVVPSGLLTGTVTPRVRAWWKDRFRASGVGPSGLMSWRTAGFQRRRWEVRVEVEESVSEAFFQHHLGEVGALRSQGVGGHVRPMGGLPT